MTLVEQGIVREGIGIPDVVEVAAFRDTDPDVVGRDMGTVVADLTDRRGAGDRDVVVCMQHSLDH